MNISSICSDPRSIQFSDFPDGVDPGEEFSDLDEDYLMDELIAEEDANYMPIGKILVKDLTGRVKVTPIENNEYILTVDDLPVIVNTNTRAIFEKTAKLTFDNAMMKAYIWKVFEKGAIYEIPKDQMEPKAVPIISVMELDTSGREYVYSIDIGTKVPFHVPSGRKSYSIKKAFKILPLN